MDFNDDYFALFGLSPRFQLEQAELERRYRELLALVHPDRHAAAAEADKRRALQWATRINEAYQILRKPLSRATYRLQLAGQDVEAERNTAMPADFLMAQMAWREAVAEARQGRDHHELEHLHHRLQAEIDADYQTLAVLLDETANWPKAAESVRCLMFLEKVLIEIDDALASLED